MKISELSPDLRHGNKDSQPLHHHHLLLDDLESSIKEAESLPSDDLTWPEKLSAKLRKSLSRLSSALPLPESAKLQIWKLSYRLWNACVDLSNAAEIRSDGRQKIHQAELRQVAADLLLLAGNPAGIPSPAFKSASFFLKTGLLWHDLARFDLAASCFERATDLVSTVQIDEVSQIGGEEEKKLLLDLNLARSRTAWEVSDRNLAIALLNRSKNLLFGSPASYKTLSEQYLQFGKLELSKKEEGVVDASKLLSEALDLCEKGIAILRGRGGETIALEGLKWRCLRFLAAERLQAADYDGVLKCVRVLRAEGGGGRAAEHPSVGYVAMRAWIGAGRVEEAERELRGMMVNKEVPESVCVSATEAYLAAAGPEAASGVLMGLVGRCRVGATAALRVVRRVVEGGGGGGGRAKVVAELVSDERVVALFDGAAAAKERNAMHAILWNCGAENFRSKDYVTSAEMFEKSMLYISRDEENRTRRSNCYRVLSLCHLGLAQLDRAQEFINEAEKLEPNIKCSFLKFKIYLQKKDEQEAITQMQAMVSCVDFNPDFLTLSAHEAIACQSLPVAMASLSVLLNLYAPGKPMPMPEVAVLRNLITLLHRCSQTEQEILKYTRHARTRMSELGVESFFGKEAVGSRELNWFAGNSWNMGLKTGKENKYESCSAFFELASEFYSAIDEENDGNCAMVCKSLILSVGAMINVEEQKKVPLPDSDIKKAIEMLSRAGKILPSVSASEQLTGHQPAAELSLLLLHTFNTYQLLNRLGEDTRSQQLQLIKSFASSKACTPRNLLQLGITASRGGRPNPEAAEFAFGACLSSALASPSPNYQIVSIALRKLAGLAGFRNGYTDSDKDDGAYGVYKQAYQIILGLKDGEYPIEEGKWLAMTAWNKSGLAVRLRQVSAARKWMKMGLDLARRFPSMKNYVGGMEECFANFEKLCGGDDRVHEGVESDSRSKLIIQ